MLELRKGQLGWKAAEKDKSPGTASNQFHITVIGLSTAGVDTIKTMMLSRRGVFYILRGFRYPEPGTCSQKDLEPLGGQKALQWSGGRGTTPSRRLTINASRVPPRALGSHGSIHAKWRRALTLTRIQPVLASKGHFPNLHFNLGVHLNKPITPIPFRSLPLPVVVLQSRRIPIAAALMASKKDMRRPDLSTFGHLSFCLPFVHVTCLADSVANSCSPCGTGQGQI